MAKKQELIADKDRGPKAHQKENAGVPAVVENPASGSQAGVPALIADLGTKGKKRFASFFTDNIRNKNTREAYHRAACQFFDWCQAHGLAVDTIESFHVSAYIEQLESRKGKVDRQAASGRHSDALRLAGGGPNHPIKPCSRRPRTQTRGQPGSDADSRCRPNEAAP